MRNPLPETVLVITQDPMVSILRPVWGTGGWLPPEEREALDWIGLLRLMGWEVLVLSAFEFLSRDFSGSRITCLILASDIADFPEEIESGIFSLMQEHAMLVLVRLSGVGSRIAGRLGVRKATEIVIAKELHYQDERRHEYWTVRHPIPLEGLDASVPFDIRVGTEGGILLGGIRKGRGRVLFFCFHPSKARDLDGAITRILRHVLHCGTPSVSVAINWDQTLALRMDDPGSSEIIHHEIYQDCAKLEEQDWSMLGKELRKRNACLSVGYVPGWVDDGDNHRSKLQVGDDFPPREPGMVHPSPLVFYQRSEVDGSSKEYDYRKEFRCLIDLIREGIVSVAAHGFTHIHPDRYKWLNATDWGSNPSWYREFGSSGMTVIRHLSPDLHPLLRAIDWMNEFYGRIPGVLIFPGEVFTEEAVQDALKFDFRLISSYYLALRHGQHFCWIQHVCAPYLDAPDAAWFDAGVPVVSCFHDWDVSRNGMAWFRQWMEAWQHAGANNFIHLAEISDRLDLRFRLEEEHGNYQLMIDNYKSKLSTCVLRLDLCFGELDVPLELEVITDSGRWRTSVKHVGPGLGLVEI